MILQSVFQFLVNVRVVKELYLVEYKFKFSGKSFMFTSRDVVGFVRLSTGQGPCVGTSNGIAGC